MAQTIYQLNGRLADGTSWKYIGVTKNLARRRGEHNRDFRQPLASYIANSTSVKVTVLEQKRNKKTAYATELKRIHQAAYRTRTTVMVNINGTK
jgi:predicted GIY-YIG superfamily endonuclease